jgi:hypothetical protein
MIVELKVIWNFQHLSFILHQTDTTMSVKSSSETWSVFGYATLASLSITAVLLLELFIPSITPRPENTSPQSIARQSVLV